MFQIFLRRYLGDNSVQTQHLTDEQTEAQKRPLPPTISQGRVRFLEWSRHQRLLPAGQDQPGATSKPVLHLISRGRLELPLVLLGITCPEFLWTLAASAPCCSLEGSCHSFKWTFQITIRRQVWVLTFKLRAVESGRE